VRPGISIQHSALPQRRHPVVRSDIGAVLGFATRDRWPPDATAGDFVELVLRRWVDLADHPQRGLFDPAALRAARCFFENGGDELHALAVCIHDMDQLKAARLAEGVLGPVFDRLRAEDDIALLCVPAAAWMRCEVARSGAVRSDADALYDELLLHCQQMANRFLVLDAPRGLHGDLLGRWFQGFRERDPTSRSFGAVYYPWVLDRDELIAPSGAVMGLFARTEHQHDPFGVGWPPANSPLLGVTHTEIEMDWAEAGSVSELGVNPLVVQPGRGVVVFGARTMSTDPTWTFINSRRIINMITEQLRRDNEWAVFEPNDHKLWRVVERDVLFRLDEFWEAGILSGARRQLEYSVECNGSTNPLSLRDSGQLNVVVSLRPVSTTERILIDLRLGSAGT
jgi:hypothetical protein